MNQDPVLAIALPLTLFCIMFSMGTTLVPADFRRVIELPKVLILGLISQMIFLPLLALAVIGLLEIPFRLQPEIIVGFMILAFSPGGTTSNMFSYLAGGRVALSITLTALVSLITPVTIPLLGALVLHWQMGEEASITLPFLPTFMKLAIVTFLPVSLGMLLRNGKPEFCDRYKALLTQLPLFMLLAVITGIIFNNFEKMPDFLKVTALPALLLASLALLLGYGIARLGRADKRDARTVAIETGIQNGGTAILVTGTILQNQAMTIAPVMYGILMLIPTFAYIFWIRRTSLAE